MNNWFKYMKLVIKLRLYGLFFISLVNTIYRGDNLLDKMFKVIYLNKLNKEIKITSNRLSYIFNTADDIAQVSCMINDNDILREGVAKRISFKLSWVIAEMTMSAHKYLKYRVVHEHEVYNEFQKE